ncbi:hypothetical protein [Gluconobacter wancherniae]|nr:hypothetical protein [Gluconobacter wancherniae]MBF0853530.1 hypothetical protein [Gluconobacter wancherniae]
MSLSSVPALEALVNQSLGKADTAAIQQGVAVSGMILQGVLGAMVTRLADHVDVNAIDAAAAKMLEGALDLEKAFQTTPAAAQTAQ